jgi:hypothetical protein
VRNVHVCVQEVNVVEGGVARDARVQRPVEVVGPQVRVKLLRVGAPQRARGEGTRAASAVRGWRGSVTQARVTMPRARAGRTAERAAAQPRRLERNAQGGEGVRGEERRAVQGPLTRPRGRWRRGRRTARTCRATKSSFGCGQQRGRDHRVWLLARLSQVHQQQDKAARARGLIGLAGRGKLLYICTR